MALEDDSTRLKSQSGAQDAAFVAVIAGEHPEAVAPWIVDDVVDVTDGPLGNV